MNHKKSLCGSRTARDIDLVRRLKAGDVSACSTLMGLYRESLYYHVFPITRNHQDAEEVVQDTFIRVHQAIESFRGESSFSTWIYQIAKNLAINRFSYWKRRRRDCHSSLNAPVEQSGDDLIDEPFSSIIPGADPDPVDLMFREEFVDILTGSIECLPEMHREVMVLYFVQNLTYNQIAEIVGVRIGTIKSRLVRARENLREIVRQKTRNELFSKPDPFKKFRAPRRNGYASAAP